MQSKLALHAAPSAVQGITVSSNLRRFDLLVEDMEEELGEAWADMSVQEALQFLRHSDAAMPEFLALAVARDDEAKLHDLGRIVRAAVAQGVRVILIADDIATDPLERLLSLGASEIVPYPLADGALHATICHIRGRAPTRNVPIDQRPDPRPNLPGRAAVFAVHGLAGGTGASTLAVNMAWELATIDKQKKPSVCLIDLDLQHASISAYLDLPHREMVVELLQDAQSLDLDGFKQALVSYGGHLSILPAPAEIVPLDIIGPPEIDAILKLAAQCFDIVVVDMPQALVTWTETVLTRTDVYFVTLELDMRSAQNAMRFQNALQSEGLPMDKLNFVLNRAPSRTDLTGRSRVNRLAETLDVNIATLLPNGGRAVTQAGDNGAPLAEVASKNGLRREIQKLCRGLHKALLSDSAMAS